MPKNLLIVESPAKAKTISKYLGGEFEVEASFGHIRDLPNRTLGVKIDDNFLPQYQNLKEKAKLIKSLQTAAKKAKTIYLATDPDREGEAIAWHIVEALGIDPEKAQRVVFNEITKSAVQQAVEHPREIDTNLVDAQQARRILDRLIGYKLSPILSKKIRKGLSAGRVQSVAVRLICDREKEIQAFIPEEYWIIEAVYNNDQPHSFKGRLFAEGSPENKLKVGNETDATNLKNRLENGKHQVHDIKTTESKRNPSAPFITSTLQQEASKKFFWSTKKTMMVAQQLYEGITINGEPQGLITYMRTDSFRLSGEAIGMAKSFIQSKFGEHYSSPKDFASKTKKNAQDAHEAIRPTTISFPPETISKDLEADQLKLYKLIWDRFIACQMSPAKIENTSVTIESKSESDAPLFLKATGYQILFDGFTKVYSEAKEDDEKGEDSTLLPALKLNETLLEKAISADQKFTQPPGRYSEASLIKELEEKGIGRPSTYAPTISTILDRHYVEKEKRKLLPTELGMTVNDQLLKFFASVIDYSFTADLETKLDEIMDGKHQWQNVVGDFFTPFSGMLDNANENMEKLKMDKPTDETCEKCGSPMVIKEGRFGAFMACSNFPECRNSKAIVTALDVDCPEDQGKLVEKRTKKGKVFYGCGNFPSCKFAVWEKPSSTENAKEIYLKEQEKRAKMAERFAKKPAAKKPKKAKKS